MTILRFIGVVILTTLAVSCSGEGPPTRPNILLIVAEDMSSRVGAYGDPVAQTPAIDRLASEGVRYTQVFTAAGVCAPSRAALITGVHPVSAGTQHMRTSTYDYEAVPAPEVKAFPELLRAAGYFTANVAKTDYQFGEPFTVWDVNAGSMAEQPDLAVWRRLPKGRPFFAMVNLMSTHESRLVTPNTAEKGRFGAMVRHFKQAAARVKRVTDPDQVEVPPYYPDTLIVRESLARLYDNIHLMDGEVGQILADLAADGLSDNTIVIWTTDHGDGLPRAKRSVYDSGLKVPMIIRYPDGDERGETRTELVSFVDLAPTILTLAGVEVPDFIQGRDFLSGPNRDYVYASRDRMDETPDRVRAVRDERFKYIRNYRPELAYFRPLEFRDLFPVMQELWQGHGEGSLAPEQEFYFSAPRPREELYDTRKDPYEIRNLTADPRYSTVLARLRGQMDQWLARVGDRSEEPEQAMIDDMWPGGVQPVTAAPMASVEQTAKGYGVTLSSETRGASIAYRILDEEGSGNWLLYTGPVPLAENGKLEAKAIRYGFEQSKVTFLARGAE